MTTTGTLIPPDAMIAENSGDIDRQAYIRTGEDHLSLAFTYAWLAATRLGRTWNPKLTWIG